jgi:Carboxypeptidase regulatory-like domain
VRAFRLVVASMAEKVTDVRSMRNLTHVLAAATAAMTLVAACTSTTFEQVGGTVIDERTGEPVAHAQLEAAAPQGATVAGSTDVQGRFTLREVHKRATLKITAANYELASLQVAEGPLEVKLTPIPVIGRVTSRLTKAGVHAALHGKAEPSETRPDGSFRVYGVSEGDTLTVSAPGYLQKSITIGAGRVEVALSPEPATEVKQIHRWLRANNLAAVWRFIFTNPSGYWFEEAPADLKAGAGKTYGVGRPEVKGVDVRVVSHDGRPPDITVIAIAWDPKFAAKPDFRVEFPASLTRAARPQTFTVRGIRVPYIALPVRGGEQVARLLLDGTITLLVESRDLNELKAFVTALLDEA